MTKKDEICNMIDELIEYDLQHATVTEALNAFGLLRWQQYDAYSDKDIKDMHQALMTTKRVH